jgi:hypothetical protein
LLHEVVNELRPIVNQRLPEQLSETAVQYNSYFMLLTAYQNLEMFDDGLALLDVIQSMYSHIPGLSEFVGERRKEFEGKRQVGQPGGTPAQTETQRTTGAKSPAGK